MAAFDMLHFSIVCLMNLIVLITALNLGWWFNKGRFDVTQSQIPSIVIMAIGSMCILAVTCVSTWKDDTESQRRHGHDSLGRMLNHYLPLLGVVIFGLGSCLYSGLDVVEQYICLRAYQAFNTDGVFDSLVTQRYVLTAFHGAHCIFVLIQIAFLVLTFKVDNYAMNNATCKVLIWFGIVFTIPGNIGVLFYTFISGSVQHGFVPPHVPDNKTLGNATRLCLQEQSPLEDTVHETLRPVCHPMIIQYCLIVTRLLLQELRKLTQRNVPPMDTSMESQSDSESFGQETNVVPDVDLNNVNQINGTTHLKHLTDNFPLPSSQPGSGTSVQRQDLDENVLGGNTIGAPSMDTETHLSRRAGFIMRPVSQPEPGVSDMRNGVSDPLINDDPQTNQAVASGRGSKLYNLLFNRVIAIFLVLVQIVAYISVIVLKTTQVSETQKINYDIILISCLLAFSVYALCATCVGCYSAIFKRQIDADNCVCEFSFADVFLLVMSSTGSLIFNFSVLICDVTIFEQPTSHEVFVHTVISFIYRILMAGQISAQAYFINSGQRFGVYCGTDLSIMTTTLNYLIVANIGWWGINAFIGPWYFKKVEFLNSCFGSTIWPTMLRFLTPLLAFLRFQSFTMLLRYRYEGIVMAGEQ
ncbi:uncharacterized protein LOC106151702 [Lingula anatina]|uniref:Uncharacterized protein LOC106151702 n=1 Tax=Lingula anatina TaxID=7574 RepID=A0A1S3H3F3_LINAN|nr:uncharacterized protein LOC106151702 [Lingula anatina]|eukprot:XP_013380538.1 uncharacterized protein LOC106151702 [Lingula anatina]